jgi:hypothetical protein
MTINKRKQLLIDFLKDYPPAFNQVTLKVIHTEALKQGLIGKSVHLGAFEERITNNYQIYDEINILKHKVLHKKDLNMYEILSYMNTKSYLSHYTSMSILGLTDQLPKDIYVTIPQKRKTEPCVLTQDEIDNSYSKPFIRTENIYNNNVLILNTMDNSDGHFQSIKHEIYGEIRLSDYEKTLIDITIRPEYSGGIYEILEAYRRCSKKISGNDLLKKLRDQNYIYPYHQVIGFYMELSGGYSKSVIRGLKTFGLDRDFYLMKGLKKENCLYDDNWKIYYPKDFKP